MNFFTTSLCELPCKLMHKLWNVNCNISCANFFLCNLLGCSFDLLFHMTSLELCKLHNINDFSSHHLFWVMQFMQVACLLPSFLVASFTLHQTCKLRTCSSFSWLVIGETPYIGLLIQVVTMWIEQEMQWFSTKLSQWVCQVIWQVVLCSCNGATMDRCVVPCEWGTSKFTNNPLIS